MAVYTEVAQIVGLYPPVSIAQTAAIGYNAPLLLPNGDFDFDSTADLVFVSETSEGNWEITQVETPPRNSQNTGRQQWGYSDIQGDRCVVCWFSGTNGEEDDKLYVWAKDPFTKQWSIEAEIGLFGFAGQVKLMGDEISMIFQPLG